MNELIAIVSLDFESQDVSFGPWRHTLFLISTWSVLPWLLWLRWCTIYPIWDHCQCQLRMNVLMHCTTL